MSESSEKSTAGSTSNEVKSPQAAIVTDQFEKMIDEAFEKTKIILQTRYDDLVGGWDKHKDEFFLIFGIDGKDTILVPYYTSGQQIDPDDAEPTPRNTPSKMEITAHQFMIDGIKRLIGICERLKVGERKYDNNWGFDLYGNFVNETKLKKGAARVANGQTLNTLPDKYCERIHIEILHRFCEMKRITGEDSRVSALCHELSHLVIYKENGDYYGGMGTDDLLPLGSNTRRKDYTDHADMLRKKKSKRVFNNAYNIERYFQIKI